MNRAPTAFFLYRDSPLRREALTLSPGAAERYSLYGLDEIAASGISVSHNLVPEVAPGTWSRRTAWALDRVVRATGGYSGDFAGVLACRSELDRAHVVFSTVDTVGIPLVLLARAGLVGPPIVYAAIGLPERLAQLRTERARRLYRAAFRRLGALVVYGWGEADELRAWLGEGGPPVEFVPFGVDTESFRPDARAGYAYDVVSVGADPRRDFRLLVELARRRSERSFCIVGTATNTRDLGELPRNVTLELDVPFRRMRERLAGARIVALPVRENSYSGATTTLLQAMASGTPVVVTRTAAIARGYHLEDGANCRLVPPADAPAFGAAIDALLDDEGAAVDMGRRARETVERHLSWRRYTGAIRDLLVSVGGITVPA